MISDSDYLFVYGTLRPSFTNSYAHYLQQHSRYVSEGTFSGLLLDLGNYPGAVYQIDSLQIVQGTIYNIGSSKQKLLSYLDEYEGVGDKFEQPHEYIRAITSINCSGKSLDCWVYLYNMPIQSKMIIESGDYERYVATKKTSLL